MHYGTPTHKPKFLLLQVIPKQADLTVVKQNLLETEQLVHTFGGTVTKTMVQQRDHPDPNLYIGSGKVAELKQWCKTEKIDIVVINGLVKSGQLFRIEKELWEVSTKLLVWDRVDLILNIFDQHATTAESKLQIQLARATHMGPRIYGLGKTELSRQGGGVGTRGKGETNIEFERRQIKVSQQKIKAELKKILKQKHKRLQKRNELGIGPIALVGYTSAGKTTLFNALTSKEKEVNKGLFTTLDTVVGKLQSAQLEQPILISDTIGFISNLPPVLIESFKSTLLESLEAKLLLHVVDVSNPSILDKVAVVDGILDSLRARQPRILVLTKVDMVSAKHLATVQKKLKQHYSQVEGGVHLLSTIPVSATSGAGLEELKKVVERFFEVG